METDLRRLRYFQTLAAELNFRRAAKRLNITQPALSRAIARLEADIGTRLFARSNRQVALTLTGSTFAKGCDRTLASLQDTVDETRRIARGSGGTLAIGYTDTSIAGRLPDIVDGFARIAPGVGIRLVQAHTMLQLKMLADRDLDVAIVTGALTGPPASPRGGAIGDGDTGTATVQSDRFMALLPAGHPLAARPSIRLADLAEQSFVAGDPEKWAVYDTHLISYCERAGFRPRVVQTAPESRAIIGLVSCGLGIGILPEALVATVDHRVVARPIAGLDARLETVARWYTADMPATLTRFVSHLRGDETA